MLKRDVRIFLFVGFLTVLLDFVVYRSLVTLGLTGIDPAKGVGFMAGAAFAYLANRFWTFGWRSHAAGSAWRFVFLYAGTLCVNIGVNSLTLKLLGEMAGAVQVAFLLATGISAALNFLGMKWFVFSARSLSQFR